MPLKLRLLIFTILWLLASLVWATWADLSLEGGESELAARAQLVYLAPLSAAHGLAFAVLPGGYNEWPDPQTWETAIEFLFLSCFAIHAAVTLTRQTRRGFLVWSAVQVLFLMASIASVLSYWHWDARNMHG